MSSNKLINVAITLRFTSCTNVIDEATLADWDGEGNAITLREYVQFAKEEGFLLEMIDSYDDFEIVDVEEV